MNFIKKLVLSTLLVIGVVAAGFAQELGDVKGNFKVEEISSKTGAPFYVSNHVKVIKGESVDLLFTINQDGDDLQIALWNPSGKGASGAEVFVMLGRDKSTIKSFDEAVYPLYIDITDFLQESYELEKFVASESLLVKIVNDNGKVSIVEIPLDGVLDVLNILIDIIENAFDDPFGPSGSDDPFGPESGANEFNAWAELVEYGELNPFDIRGMIDVFITDALVNHGIDLRYVYDGDVTFEFESTETLNERYGEDMSSVLAFTDALGRDRVVHVVVNTDNWTNAEPIKRLAIMYHELAHDILNFEHGTGGDLMKPHALPSYSVESLFELKTELFETYKRLN